MTKDTSKFLRLGTLSLLYFVQGAPYGFQTACIPLILRQSGLSFTGIGAMKLLFIPWVCKPLFAPFVEKTKSKKWWLIFSMSLLGISCLLAGFLVDLSNLLGLSVLLFILNFLAATQDISVDTLAIQALTPEELGAGNTVQVVAYKMGSVFAGGFLLYVEQMIGWTGMFVCFALIYFVSVILLCRLRLVERSSYYQAKDEESIHDHQAATVLSALKVPGTVWMMAFVLFYKLCERAEQTFSLFMVDKRVPMSQLAFWSTIMKTGSLLGSTYGGWALSGTRDSTADKVILQFSLIRSFSIFCQLLLILFWGQVPIETEVISGSDLLFVYASFSLLCITLFTAGAITTATFTLMMRLSQTAPASLQGTHYTILATCEVFGKLVFAIFAGWLTDQLGLLHIYAIFVILAVINIPFILNTPLAVSKLCKSSAKI